MEEEHERLHKKLDLVENVNQMLNERTSLHTKKIEQLTTLTDFLKETKQEKSNFQE